MASIKQDLFFREFDKAAVLPVYYFYGEESFLMDEALVRFKARFIPEGSEDFNMDVFYYNEVNITQVVDALQMLPMFAEKRLIVLKNISELKAKDQEVLLEYFAAPNPSCVFILLAKKVDQRKKIFKVMQEIGHLVAFDSPSDREVPQWIQYIAKKFDKTINADASHLLFQFVGNSLSDLKNEIQKLSQYVGTRNDIQRTDIEAVVTRLRMESVFDLCRAIGENDRAKAIYYLAHLLGNGENELGIMALISRHIRILSLVKEGSREGLSAGQLASRAGVPPYYVKEYLDQSRTWNEAKLGRIHHALLTTDKALKSSPLSSHIWLENFVLTTCN